jgi:uncharacterized protein (TIGR02099 family)
VLLVVYFLLGSLVLAGRHWILPDIDTHRGRVEQALTESIGMQVRIGEITADWPGLHPSLSIEGLQLMDKAGHPALSFDRVEAEVGWSSLLHLDLRLHRLQIVAPSLDIRRDRDGNFHVAGLLIQGEGDGSFADWLLAQGRIVISNARIRWHDELRSAPPLELQQLNFELRNTGQRHRFGLTAAPPAQVARSLDLRGTLTGQDRADPAGWRGELYADLNQADLSAWSPWIDLPMRWSRGLGGLRLWMGFTGMQPTGVTADLRLTDVSLRLRHDLPKLNLKHLDGRLTAHRTDEGYVGEIRQLSLTTPEGLDLAPTDARLLFRTDPRQEGGEFRTNQLDFGVMAALAGYLPLPAEVHARLQAFQPQGRLSDLELNWRGTAESPTHWQAKGTFANLALAAYHELPGFGGISGRFKGNETTGEVVLDSRQAEILLPAVFPEPRLALERLVAEIGWQSQNGKVDLLFNRFAFSNHDANGEATGRYRYTGDGPGEIDLSAKLTNAAGNAVWRYMPLVVNKDARDWLQASIGGGHADNVTLRLKGPLYEFPFRDGKDGIFQVKGVFRGATLKYAPHWPEITDIDGELLFEGVRMQIRAQRGNISGTVLAEVLAEIPDLEQAEEILTVTGKARGATQQFLEFIEASPVGERIDHFTRPMTATGAGELDLRLVMPLRRVAQTRVDGRFRLAGNQLRVLPVLPLLTDVQGEFAFTGDQLHAKGLRARVFGTPLALDVRTLAGGALRVDGSGTIVAQALRREPVLAGLRLFDHLSGESPWRGSVKVKKPGAEILLESNLAGFSSSLPEPFNKSATGALPLKVDGRIDPRGDSWKVSLGSLVGLQFLQAGNDWRGRLALGSAAVRAGAALPARGVALAVAMPQVDLDAWRDLLPDESGSVDMPGLSLATIDLRVPELRLGGRDFHEVQMQATRNESRWRIGLEGREAQGQLVWDGTGAGRISGRLANLMLPSPATSTPALAETAGTAEREDATWELPAVDLVIDNFRLRNMALGEARVKAENREGAWQAKLELRNEAARLSGEGRWRPGRIAPETKLNFKLDVTDAEKLLGRLGMPDAVRRGTARLEGDIYWGGSPFNLDVPTLSGQIRLEAEKGQFKKLEPGVGRLLGVLSLQSLPRRITLDFRDIFSDGFAFDSIVGAAQIERGQMKTDELRIRGPAAKVLISGHANLSNETHDLRVRVQPAIGESLAVGAMIANPVVGAVAWAAQKIFNDPLDQAFAYEYVVTGNWNDPQVEKVSAAAPESKGGSQ